jgi:hypothetical protein
MYVDFSWTFKAVVFKTVREDFLGLMCGRAQFWLKEYLCKFASRYSLQPRSVLIMLLVTPPVRPFALRKMAAVAQSAGAFDFYAT